MTGETIWQGFNTLTGPAAQWGYQYVPEGEDVDFSRFDQGSGWDQALTMDRAPVDHYVQPLSAMAVPPGIQVTRDATYLNLIRNTGNASDEVTPQFRMTGLGDRFDSPLALIEWAPMTEVIHSGGFATQTRADVLPQTAKMLPDYYYGVIDGEAILDEAIARTRRAMYGR